MQEPPITHSPLLQRNETRRVRGTNTGPTVLDRLVCDGELAKVVANHLRLDLHLVELLSGVDADNAANHLRHDDHITQMSLDKLRLLVWLSLLLSLAQLLDEAERAALQTPVDLSPRAGVEDVPELIGVEVEQAVKQGSVLALLIRQFR